MPIPPIAHWISNVFVKEIVVLYVLLIRYTKTTLLPPTLKCLGGIDSTMSKSKDTKRESKKAPQKSAKEKKEAKRAKKEGTSSLSSN